MGKKNKAEAKKFLPEKRSAGYDGSSKFASIIKLIIFILLLPAAAGVSYGFINTLSNLDSGWVSSFWLGVFVFFIIDLTICRLDTLYKNGQRLIEIIFHFVAPLVKFAPYVLPVYALLILAFSVTMGFFGVISSHQKILLFLASYSVTLHLVYTTDTLRTERADFLRGNRFFTIIIIYLCNIAILAFAIDRILPDSRFFIEFFNNSHLKAANIYQVIFAQFFLI